jgi:hypothetical protein
MRPIPLGSRRELFVDKFLTDTLDGLAFRLNTPQLAPAPASPIQGHYMTVLRDGSRFRAYYRQYDPSYTGVKGDGNPGEITLCSESANGVEWCHPDYGLVEVNGSRHNHAVLRQVPFSHNFAPFLDANPAAAPEARFKALAGVSGAHGSAGTGLHAFRSADGIRWQPMQAGAVFNQADFAFDSQNVSFWSVEEGCYVCYFRSWLGESRGDRLRSISRITSEDFLNWSDPVRLSPNLPGEHLYTSQTHPYFRAPHLYIALPTRFQPDRGASTDILFMATRAGSDRFERLFSEAFILPGPDPKRWGNRSNYAACGVVPTGPTEMSIYHGPAGRRYTLRTDGFISIHAGYAGGTLTTRPFTFTGEELTLNVATSAAGSVRVELQDETGRPLPGRALADADEIASDSLDQRVTWKGDSDVSALAGRPVRLRLALREADLYSLVFGPSFYGPANRALSPYFAALTNSGAADASGRDADQLERRCAPDLIAVLGPAVEQAGAAVRGQAEFEQRLAPIADGYTIARRIRELLDILPTLPADEAARRLDAIEKDVLRFDPDMVFSRGPALYPPLPASWIAFRKDVVRLANMIAAMFLEPRLILNLDKAWRFQTDPDQTGLAKNWMRHSLDDVSWPLLDADRWWQLQGYPEYHGTAWYRRSFTPPTLAPGRRLMLFFGAVDGDALVFLNGERLGEHALGDNGEGWDQPFHFDITDRLAAGAAQLLAVRVHKTRCMSGIFRGVKLLETGGLKNPGKHDLGATRP